MFSVVTEQGPRPSLVHLKTTVPVRVCYCCKRWSRTVFGNFRKDGWGPCSVHLQTTVHDHVWYIYKRQWAYFADCDGKRQSADRPDRDLHLATAITLTMIWVPDTWRSVDYRKRLLVIKNRNTVNMKLYVLDNLVHYWDLVGTIPVSIYSP